MRSDRSAKLIEIRLMKKSGVESDFLISFSGVLTMKQEHTLGSLSIPRNSLYNEGSDI